ncbi:MAG: DsbA family protein [Patescibacteria group bacterium]
MENLHKNQGFFDANPKTLFFFGLVTGIALTMIISGFIGLPSAEATKVSENNKAKVIDDQPGVARPKTSTIANLPTITSEDHIRGDKNAPLTLIEYSDFECPFCKSFNPTVLRMLDEFDGEINLVYRHFPLSFHEPLASKEAQATECANELGGNDAFWAMADLIFARTTSNGNGLSISDLPKMAMEIGINESEFSACLDSDRYINHIQDDIAGGSAAGIAGTPGSFLIDRDGNAQLISGAVPYEQIKALIEASR